MYTIFRVTVADHQGGGVDSWYPFIRIENYDEALSNLIALKDAGKEDSWTEYHLYADKAEVDDLRSEIESLENHIDDLNYQEY